MTHTEALKLALGALEWSDNTLLEGTPIQVNQQRAIAAIKEALTEDVPETTFGNMAQPQQETNEYVAGFNDGLIGASELRTLGEKIAQPQQEPVAWLTEERYAEMHTSKWTPKIQQVFSKDGILESQTIQYAPQSKPVSYPPPQRTWVGLTAKEVADIVVYPMNPTADVVKAIEAKLKEKNT